MKKYVFLIAIMLLLSMSVSLAAESYNFIPDINDPNDPNAAYASEMQDPVTVVYEDGKFQSLTFQVKSTGGVQTRTYRTEAFYVVFPHPISGTAMGFAVPVDELQAVKPPVGVAVTSQLTINRDWVYNRFPDEDDVDRQMWEELLDTNGFIGVTADISVLDNGVVIHTWSGRHMIDYDERDVALRQLRQTYGFADRHVADWHTRFLAYTWQPSNDLYQVDIVEDHEGNHVSTSILTPNMSGDDVLLSSSPERELQEWVTSDTKIGGVDDGDGKKNPWLEKSVFLNVEYFNDEKSIFRPIHMVENKLRRSYFLTAKPAVGYFG